MRDKKSTFVVYINDIDDSVASKVLKFADDTKIYGIVNTAFNIDNMRSDLCNLFSWSVEWQMLFNIEKCKVMHLGFNNPCIDYIMNGKSLKSVTEEKDLGVIVSEDFKWEKQCSHVVSKANKALGMNKRNFVDRSKETIYYPRIQKFGQISFGIQLQVWNPYFNKDIKLIVQRRATKLVHDMEHLSYDNRLEKLGLMRLSDRRARGDLIETFKTDCDMYDLRKRGFF